MTLIRVKNFGPIKEGYVQGNGFLDVKKVTIFIGNQGAGKSTIAKLISTLSWLEKSIIRNPSQKAAFSKAEVFKKHCSYQNISEYFKSNTEIEFKGDTFHFLLKNDKVSIDTLPTEEYFLPKIMYVPADRNLISAVRNVANLKGLPGTLYTFSDEFVKAVNQLKGTLELPINGVSFEYQKLNELSYIIGEDYKIRLSNASSGFQSLVPLYIVSKYLAESIVNKNDSMYNQSTIEHSIEEEYQIREEIESIMSNPNLTEKVKTIYLERLSSKYRYSAFLNIVEEPEQNLYPSSQRHILNSLLHFNNLEKKNGLVITTHSPYLINYLTLAVKAFSVSGLNLDEKAKKTLRNVVPEESMLHPDDLAIYEMDEHSGRITPLETLNGIPSDENRLNLELGEFNDLYAQLLTIQQQNS